jgi:hypothetical protein
MPHATFILRTLVGVVAQLVEHHNGIVGVRGSNPLGSTTPKSASQQARGIVWRDVIFQSFGLEAAVGELDRWATLRASCQMNLTTK